VESVWHTFCGVTCILAPIVREYLQQSPILNLLGGNTMSHARSWLRQRFKKAPLIPKIDDQEDVPKQDAAHQAVARTMRRLCSACQRICGSNVGSLKDPENDTHHATASDCKRAVRSGCPVCAVVWRHATADGTVDVTSLKLKAAFSTWSVSTNGERDAHQRHRHWPEDTVTLTISTGSVSVAQGLGPMHIFANDNVDFALVETSREYCVSFARGLVDLPQNAGKMFSVERMRRIRARTPPGCRSKPG